MLDFLLNAHNFWFTVAIAIMLGLLVLELLTMLIGASLSGIIDNILPDFDANLDVDAASPSVGAKVLNWFCLDKVPALIVFIIFLAGFGLMGLIAQTILIKFFGIVLHTWIITPLVFIASIPISQKIVLLFRFLVPTEETSAVSTDSFIGKVATISQGVARLDLPAEAKLKDEHGQTHYVRVEPDKEEKLTKGTQVILFDKKPGSNVFLANKLKY